MNECTECGGTTKTDEWSDYNKKICIDCVKDNENICEPMKEIDG
jgi:hypothetical protein|tara:strand:+ start:266 stop:397 length:132 start_codon:yes stop_codon:yes gene_type:complete